MRSTIGILAIGLILAGCDSGGQNASSLSQVSVAQTQCNPSGAPFGGGSGTTDDPYLVCTADQFQNIQGNQTSFIFSLTEDLDLSSLPQTFAIDQFSGGLDGQNHTLRNFTQVNAPASQGGLFTFGTGFIKNLTLQNFNITAPVASAMLIGQTHARTVIDNVSIVGGHITSTSSIVANYVNAGIAALNYGTILNSSSNLTVADISNPVNEDDLKAGIAATNYGTVSNCTSTLQKTVSQLGILN